MPSDNRDQQFERALAQHLRNASPYSDCPDAETLAAYHERTLSLEELARWKEHIARCTRCQESLALVERSEDLPAEEWEHQNVPVPLDGIVLPQHMRAAGANIQQKEVVLNAAPASTPTPIRKAAERPQWRWIVPAGALAASVIVWIGVKEIRTQRGHPVESVQVAQNRPVGAETPAPSIETRDQLKQEEPAQRPLPEENRLQSKVATPAPRSMPSPKIAAPGVAGAPLSTTGDASTAVQKDKEFSSGERVVPPQPVPPVSSYNAKSEAKEMLAPPAANAPFQAGAGGGATAKSPTRAQKKAETSAMAESVEVQGAAPSAATLSAISGKVLDPSGAAIRGAAVTVISASSGNSTSAVADDDGKFQVAGLHGDEYRVVVSHAGFTSSEQTL